MLRGPLSNRSRELGPTFQSVSPQRKRTRKEADLRPRPICQHSLIPPNTSGILIDNRLAAAYPGGVPPAKPG